MQFICWSLDQLFLWCCEVNSDFTLCYVPTLLTVFEKVLSKSLGCSAYSQTCHLLDLTSENSVIITMYHHTQLGSSFIVSEVFGLFQVKHEDNSRVVIYKPGDITVYLLSTSFIKSPNLPLLQCIYMY